MAYLNGDPLWMGKGGTCNQCKQEACHCEERIGSIFWCDDPSLRKIIRDCIKDEIDYRQRVLERKK